MVASHRQPGFISDNALALNKIAFKQFSTGESSSPRRQL